MAQGRVNEAIEAYGRALAGRPDAPATRVNLATALRAAERPEAARAELDRALARDPDNAAALTLAAQDLKDLGDWAGALDKLTRACERAPRDVNALSTLVGLAPAGLRLARFRGARRNNWTPWTRPTARCRCRPSRRSSTCRAVTIRPRTTVVQRAWSKAIEARMAAARERLAFSHGPRAPGPLTIGYLSQDFRDHPVGHLVRGLFAAHDRARRCGSTAIPTGPTTAAGTGARPRPTATASTTSPARPTRRRRA